MNDFSELRNAAVTAKDKNAGREAPTGDHIVI
jgi:hypothetical protein